MPEHEDPFLEAYEATESDAEAAALLGVKHSAFALWRHRQGLPARSHAEEGDEDGYMATYLRASGDADAAKRLGIKKAEFQKWREGKGLPER